jgi:hypothetical protein
MDSEANSWFVEVMLTAVATCRLRGREGMAFLVDCLKAIFGGKPVASLLARTARVDPSRAPTVLNGYFLGLDPTGLQTAPVWPASGAHGCATTMFYSQILL